MFKTVEPLHYAHCLKCSIKAQLQSLLGEGVSATDNANYWDPSFFLSVDAQQWYWFLLPAEQAQVLAQ